MARIVDGDHQVRYLNQPPLRGSSLTIHDFEVTPSYAQSQATRAHLSPLASRVLHEHEELVDAFQTRFVQYVLKHGTYQVATSKCWW